MKRKLLLTTALLSCFIFVMATVFAGLDGKWKGVIQVPGNGDLPVTYVFKTDGDKLTGTAESQAGVVTIDNGKITGDTFSFKVTVDGNDYAHKGKMYADSCGMDIDFGGTPVHFTIKRDTTK